jgi:hypothetical protein
MSARPSRGAAGAAATSAGWPDALRGVLSAVFARAGLDVPFGFAAWRERAIAGGPTPASGPLTHDLVLPRGDSDGGVGLNLFRQPPEERMHLACDWAAGTFGARAADAARDLLTAVPDGVEVAPGAFVSRGGARLKLYFGGGDAKGLMHLAQRIGVTAEPGTRGLAVDIGAGGVARPRAYRTLAHDDAVLASLGTTAARWGEAQPAGDALRHAIVESLGAWPDAGAKRSLVRTFAPNADIEALIGYEQALVRHGVPMQHPLDAAWLRTLAASVARDGFALCAVAHETDLFPDGRVASDVFVCLGGGAAT